MILLLALAWPAQAQQFSSTIGSKPPAVSSSVFGTPSLDPSSEWFAKKTGKRARQGITAFTVDKGLWSNYSIL